MPFISVGLGHVLFDAVLDGGLHCGQKTGRHRNPLGPHRERSSELPACPGGTRRYHGDIQERDSFAERDPQPDLIALLPPCDRCLVPNDFDEVDAGGLGLECVSHRG